MKSYKLYGTKYELSPTSDQAPDAYAVKGDLVYEVPKGKMLGYITMEDDSVIECYKQFNPMTVIIPLIILLVGGIAVFAYFRFLQPKDAAVGDFVIKQSDDTNVVSYNGFMAISDGNLSVNFTNGDYVCTITVEGEGISCNSYTVQPGEFVASIPATFTTEDGLVMAKIVMQTETSTVEQDVVVEIPENNTPNSPDSGLEGYWKGEYVYGTDIEPAE